MTATRVYTVRATVGDSKPRLVRATHPAHALRHVAEDAFAVKVASQDELIDALSKGFKIEAIGQEQQEIAG